MADNHLAMVRVNRDASLFLAAPGSAVPDRHAPAVPGDWFGTAHRPPAGFAAGRAGRSLQRSISGLGRNNCKSAPARGIPRRGTAVLTRLYRDQTDGSGLDFRPVWRDIDPACVPGTVCGHGAEQNCQVEVGAVPGS